MIGTLEGLSLTHNTELDVFFTLVQTVEDLMRGFLAWLTGYLRHRQLPTDGKLMQQEFPIDSLRFLVSKYGPCFLQYKAAELHGEFKYVLQNIESVVFDVENLYREAFALVEHNSEPIHDTTD